jgi:site-specific DNA-methyltransferase (adenine-specific)
MVDFIKSIGKIHSKAMMSYILYMAQRLIELHRILKETGSLYLHCDPTASHYLKQLLDAIFDKNNFRNEIVWAYRKWTNAATYFQKNHDIILHYAKNSDEVYFNKIYDTPAESQQEVIKRGYNVNKVSDGLQLLIYNKQIFDEMVENKKIDTSKYIRIIDKSESEGTAMNDVWNIQYLHSQSKERTGYPTQKPLALMEWCLTMLPDTVKTICDPFM